MVLTRAGLGQYFGATFPNTTIPFTTLPIISNDISDGEIPLQVSGSHNSSDSGMTIIYILLVAVSSSSGGSK